MDGPSDIRQTGRRYRAGARHTAGVGTEASERRSRAGFRRQDGARWRAGYGRESDAGGAFRGRTQGSAGEVAQGWEGEEGEGSTRMTDIQLLTLALAVSVPLSLLIYSNSRIGDLRTDMHASINETKETLRAEMRAQFAELLRIIERNHSEVMAKLTDLDNRLTKLENERRIVQ